MGEGPGETWREQSGKAASVREGGTLQAQRQEGGVLRKLQNTGRISLGQKSGRWACEMAQWVKGLAAKSDSPSSISGSLK